MDPTPPANKKAAPPRPTCRLMEVEKHVPDWLAHRKKVLQERPVADDSCGASAVLSYDNDNDNENENDKHIHDSKALPGGEKNNDKDKDNDSDNHNDESDAKALFFADKALSGGEKMTGGTSNISGSNETKPSSSGLLSSANNIHEGDNVGVEGGGDENITVGNNNSSSSHNPVSATGWSTSSATSTSAHQRSVDMIWLSNRTAEIKSTSNQTEGQSLEMVATAEMKSISNRTEGLSLEMFSENGTAEMKSESNRTEGQSLEIMSQSNGTVEMKSESNRTAEMKSESNRTEGQSLEIVSESNPTAEQISPSAIPTLQSTQEITEDIEKEVPSHQFFWGNPVRFANTLREIEEEGDDSENATTGEIDPDHQERRQQPRAVEHLWMTLSTKTTKSSRGPDPPSNDPPSALDDSICSNSSRNSSSIKTNTKRSRSRSGRSDWMPPEEADDGDVMSVVSATIAEALERLTKLETDSSTAAVITPRTSDSSAKGIAKGTKKGSSRRIDFAGNTTAHSSFKSGKTNKSEERNREKREGDTTNTRGSRGKTIRKYYDNGKNSDEKVRYLYMPTAVPAIANLGESEDELFDWVPEQSKARSIQHDDVAEDDDDNYDFFVVNDDDDLNEDDLDDDVDDHDNVDDHDHDNVDVVDTDGDVVDTDVVDTDVDVDVDVVDTDVDIDVVDTDVDIDVVDTDVDVEANLGTIPSGDCTELSTFYEVESDNGNDSKSLTYSKEGDREIIAAAAATTSISAGNEMNAAEKPSRSKCCRCGLKCCIIFVIMVAIVFLAVVFGLRYTLFRDHFP